MNEETAPDLLKNLPSSTKLLSSGWVGWGLSLDLGETLDHLSRNRHVLTRVKAFRGFSELESQRTMANSTVLPFSFLRNKCRWGGAGGGERLSTSVI